ncbi:MAG: leucine--tRNA ligase [bacterium]|nr:leucine--tRNA ligase [bacterium]
MSDKYTPVEIESKWQKRWEEEGSFVADDNIKEKKFYCLDMFPYPSASGLHVGHPEGYTATDILSRYKRMQGYNVLHPMGWDAFGLPAENFAIKTGVHPDKSTHENIKTFTRQIKSLGFSYDWNREIDTSSPEYYKWTQWMFLQMYEHGLAYKKKARVNWCDTCQTVLANEQVVNGKCERSQDAVVQKDLEQWFFKITYYADQLIDDLDAIDWPEPIKLMQKNWIGRSEGTEVIFQVKDQTAELKVYTTRVDTIYSAAFMVLAPEHELVDKLTTDEQRTEVDAYVKQATAKTELDRTSLEEKTGVFTGAYAINPVNGEEVPIWIGDFVLAGYGTGAVFGDAHDDRDFAMAKKFNIPLKISIRPKDEVLWKQVKELEVCYTDDGILINSDQFDGLTSSKARVAITAWLEEKQRGQKKINYKVRDWLISRQRYWGAPIPIVYDPEGNPHPVKLDHLPLQLPTDVDYNPKGTSPLGSSDAYKKLAEELYGKGWYFEIDTMDTFVCSSWYYLRYCDPQNTEEFASAEKLKQWLPVDMYVGGAEHAVMHLLYARFFHKALQDFGFIPQEVGREPFIALRNQGMILGEDHQKMSKSRGNVVNPDEVVAEYGADTIRLYEMFIGPFEDAKPWKTDSIKGIYRFLDKVFRLSFKVTDTKVDVETERMLHQTIKQVTADIEGFRFNTAISQMMILTNHLTEQKTLSKETYQVLLQLLSPFAPHLAETLWQELGNTELIMSSTWPQYQAELLIEEKVEVVVQVNGKVRDRITVDIDVDEQSVKDLAEATAGAQRHITDKHIVKIIYVPNKLVNIVVK